MENASAAFLGAVRRSMRVIRTAIGATTINQELLTCAERLQFNGQAAARVADTLQSVADRRSLPYQFAE